MSSMVNIAVVLDVFPQASVAEKMTVAPLVDPHVAVMASKSLLHVTPLQTSEAEAPPLFASHASTSAVFPKPSHSTVMLEASTTAGPSMSSIVNTAIELAALPQASVAVKVTVADPVAPQSSLNELKSLVHVTSPQASIAVAPPLLAIHASSSPALPVPSHATVAFAASVNTGAVESVTVML